MANCKIPISNEYSMANSQYDIRERTLMFAVNTAKFIKSIPLTIAYAEYAKQLIRSSASIGANLEEADGALSKKDFINKVAISRREARESRYWLKLIQSVEIGDHPAIKSDSDKLIEESRQIILILSSIVNKVRAKHSGP